MASTAYFGDEWREYGLCSRNKVTRLIASTRVEIEHILVVKTCNGAHSSTRIQTNQDGRIANY